MDEERRRMILRQVGLARLWLRVSLAGIAFGLLLLGVFLYAQYSSSSVGPLADSSFVAVGAFALLGVAVVAITQLQRTIVRIRGLGPPVEQGRVPD